MSLVRNRIDVELPAADVPPGTVVQAGGWAVANSAGTVAAVSRRWRHQLADLATGSIDADGCLVCPWHQSRYDLATGAMVSGPRGFLGYHGPTPGYSALIRLTGAVLPLRRAIVERVGSLLRISTG